MPDEPGCEACIHWQRLKGTAVIGHCLHPASGQSFTHERDSCPHHQPPSPPPSDEEPKEEKDG